MCVGVVVGSNEPQEEEFVAVEIAAELKAKWANYSTEITRRKGFPARTCVCDERVQYLCGCQHLGSTVRGPGEATVLILHSMR